MSRVLTVAASLQRQFQAYATSGHVNTSQWVGATELDTALQAAGRRDMRRALPQLLELADAIIAAGDRLCGDVEEARSHLDALPGEGGGVTEWACRRLTVARLSVMVNTRLVRYVPPACDSLEDRERLLAASNILFEATWAMQQLVPGKVLPEGMQGLDALAWLTSMDGCAANILFGMAEVLELEGKGQEVPPWLGPWEVFDWMLQLMDTLELLQNRLGLRHCAFLDGLFKLLASVTALGSGLQEYRDAMCVRNQSRLMLRLAALTTASYAALPTWQYAAEAGHLAWSKLAAWVASWRRLRFPFSDEEMAPLLLAAGSVLAGEARHAQHMELAFTQRGVQDWQLLVETIYRSAQFMLGQRGGADSAAGGAAGSAAGSVAGRAAGSVAAAGSAAGSAASGEAGSAAGSTVPPTTASPARRRQVFLALAESAAPIARFFAGVAAGQVAKAMLLEGYLIDDLGTDLDEWARTCLLATIAVLDCPPPGNSQQRQRLGHAAGDLAAALTWLAPHLPQLTHVLNGGSSAVCPEDGCRCPACMAPIGHMRLEGGRLVGAVAAALKAASSMLQPGDLASANGDQRLALLAAHCCKLPHALAQLSDRQLQLMRLATMGGGLAGRMAQDSADVLRAAAVDAAVLALGALQAGVPLEGEDEEEAREQYDREVACCLLEAAAAVAAAAELGGPQAAAEPPGTVTHPRQLAITSLRSLAARSVPGGVPLEECGEVQVAAAPLAADEEGAVLAALSSLLHQDSLRPHMAALLARLLPAPDAGDDATQQQQEQEQPQQHRVAVEAALLQARALGQSGHRRCAHVRCPSLTAGCDLAQLQQAAAKRCGGCRVVRYCSDACSHTDWKAHQAACRVLKAPRTA